MIRAVIKSLARLNAFMVKVEELVLASGIAILTGISIVNVIARELHRSLYFAEEISYFFVILITFAGFSYGVRKARHIRMAALFDLMPEKIKKALTLILSLLSSAVVFFMAYQALIYTLRVAYTHQTTPCLLWPYWIFLAVIPVGFFFGGIHYLRTIYKNILEKPVWLSPERQSEYED